MDIQSRIEAWLVDREAELRTVLGDEAAEYVIAGEAAVVRALVPWVSTYDDHSELDCLSEVSAACGVPGVVALAVRAHAARIDRAPQGA